MRDLFPPREWATLSPAERAERPREAAQRIRRREIELDAAIRAQSIAGAPAPAVLRSLAAVHRTAVCDIYGTDPLATPPCPTKDNPPRYPLRPDGRVDWERVRYLDAARESAARDRLLYDVHDEENVEDADARHQREAIDARHREAAEGTPPKSVTACMTDSWSLALYPRDLSTRGFVVPFRCRTWRCPRCRKYVFMRDRERVLDGLTRHGPRGWSFIVATTDPADWNHPAEAWANISRQWSALAKRLARLYAEPWLDRDRNRRESLQYVVSLETTANGWPHLNILIRSHKLAAEIEAAPRRKGGNKRLRSFDAVARACGFGQVSDCSTARSLECLAAYATKTAGKAIEGARAHLRIVGEAVKTRQIPTGARYRSRRIRASVGLLEPFRKPSEAWTGALIPRPVGQARAIGICIPVAGPLEQTDTNSVLYTIAWCDAVEKQDKSRKYRDSSRVCLAAA